MGSTENLTYGTVRYNVPNHDDRWENRAFFMPPAAKIVKDEKVPLHDFRTATDIVKGPKGLDVQGFTYIDHKSCLTTEEMLTGRNIEDYYIQELIDLMLEVTGASRGLVHMIACRRKQATETAESAKGQSLRKGEGIDPYIEKTPLDGVLVSGRDSAGAMEPARRAHCDFSRQGLLDSMRFFRKDLSDMGSSVLSDENEGRSLTGPRCAVYSVWRPLKQVKQDPIAALDWRTLEKSDLTTFGLRVPSYLNDEGEYNVEQYAAVPPKNLDSHRWYWMPEQTPEEVLIIKFADTAQGNGIAEGCLHCSPVIATENDEPRESIESRVYVFWD